MINFMPIMYLHTILIALLLIFYRNVNHSDRTDLQLNIYLYVHLHGMGHN